MPGKGGHTRESTGDREPGQVSLFQEKQLGEWLVIGKSCCPAEPWQQPVWEHAPPAAPAPLSPGLDSSQTPNPETPGAAAGTLWQDGAVGCSEVAEFWQWHRGAMLCPP